jgi:hypothetical protein
MCHPVIKWFWLLLLLPIIPLTQTVSGGGSRGGDEKLSADWWTISDKDFVTQYGKLATGTQEQQSQFAWMAFARVNQQVASGQGQKLSQWELWAST